MPQLDQVTLDALRANNAAQQLLLAGVEPTPDPNPLQAQLDAALEREQGLIEANETLQAVVSECRTLAQAILNAAGTGE